MRFRLAAAALGALLCTGCLILPIPHRRIHAYGVRGRIVDASTREPIKNAEVSPLLSFQSTIPVIRSDAQGGFAFPAVKGWHGAYLISPISISLFPGFDMTGYDARIRVFAPGYIPRDVEIRGHQPDDPPPPPEFMQGKTEAVIDGAYLDVGDLPLSPVQRSPP